MQGAALPSQATAAEKAAAVDGLFPKSALDNHASRRILVLNRNWQAVNIVGIRHAFALLFREDAQVIDASENGQNTYDIEEWLTYSLENPPAKACDALLTTRFPVRIPDVLILNDYDRLPMKEARLSRESIFERDEYTCQYCGGKHSADELNIDHVIPRERGGRNTWENLVTSCIRCNERKANRLPHEAGMRLQRRPRKPPARPFAASAISEHWANPEWRMFLHA